MYLTFLSCCVKYYDRTSHSFDMKTLLRVCVPPLEQTMKQTTGQTVEKPMGETMRQTSWLYPTACRKLNPNEDLSASSSNAGNNFLEPRFTSWVSADFRVRYLPFDIIWNDRSSRMWWKGRMKIVMVMLVFIVYCDVCDTMFCWVLFKY